MMNQLIIKLIFVSLMMIRSYRHKSLTSKGLVFAYVTGIIHSISDTWLHLILLFGFFITGTAFTKLKIELKKSLTVTVSKSGVEGPRNHVQVLANSIMASVLIVLGILTNIDQTLLNIGIIAQYAAVTADTWSSEIGILSKSNPILITTLRTCPKGTNGGVSLLGLEMAILGGLFIGVLSIITSISSFGIYSNLLFIIFIGFLGLFGSLLDSILGALFQSSSINSSGKIVEADGGYRLSHDSMGNLRVISGSMGLLSNNQVNLSMAVITSLVGMVVYGVGVGGLDVLKW